MRPVREGHRLSLVFNLCLRAGDEDTPRQAPDFTSHTDRIAARLVAWRDRHNASDKLVWVLDHDYSEAGLSFDALKNVDAALARTLAPAAARADCELYAAIVHATVHGDATYDGHYVDGWGDWADEDADRMEIDEVYENRVWLDGWAGRDGRRPPFDEVPVLPGELLPRGALDDAEPDEQRLHEATGNEGATLERAYRRVAFVIWPRSRTLDVIASTGVDGAVAWVAAELDRNGGTADERIAHLFTKLIDLWPTDGDHDRDRSSRARMLDVLSGIDDEARTLRFLRNVVLSRYRRGDNEHLPAALRVVGLDAADRLLADLVTAHVTPRTSAVLALLRLIEGQCRESAESAWRDVLRKSVHAALVTLCEALAARTGDDEDEPKAAFNAIEDTFIEDENDWVEDDEEDDDWVEEDDDPQAAEPGRPGSSAVTLRDLVAFRAGGAVRRPAWSLGDEAVRDVFALTSRCGLTSDAARAATLIVRLPEVVAPDRTLPAALGDLHREEGLPDTAPYAALWGRATASLLGRNATPPDEPRDWKIASDTNCDCAHCAELRAFCENPDAEVGRFPLREELRCHLEMIIRTRHLDIDHVTERKGRPYTLVCTKNRASHQRRLAEYAEDVSHMESLVRSAPGRCAGRTLRVRSRQTARGGRGWETGRTRADLKTVAPSAVRSANSFDRSFTPANSQRDRKVARRRSNSTVLLSPPPPAVSAHFSFTACRSARLSASNWTTVSRRLAAAVCQAMQRSHSRFAQSPVNGHRAQSGSLLHLGGRCVLPDGAGVSAEPLANQSGRVRQRPGALLCAVPGAHRQTVQQLDKLRLALGCQQRRIQKTLSIDLRRNPPCLLPRHTSIESHSDQKRERIPPNKLSRFLVQLPTPACPKMHRSKVARAFRALALLPAPACAKETQQIDGAVVVAPAPAGHIQRCLPVVVLGMQVGAAVGQQPDDGVEASRRSGV